MARRERTGPARPGRHSAGSSIARASNPHGVTNTRSSSNQPPSCGSIPTRVLSTQELGVVARQDLEISGPEEACAAHRRCSAASLQHLLRRRARGWRAWASPPSRTACELDHVLLAHAGEEVEAGRVVRSDRCERCDCGDTIGKERRGRERVGAAARDAPGAEPLDPERVAERRRRRPHSRRRFVLPVGSSPP